MGFLVGQKTKKVLYKYKKSFKKVWKKNKKSLEKIKKKSHIIFLESVLLRGMVFLCCVLLKVNF